eukprot:gene10661-12445_t
MEPSRDTNDIVADGGSSNDNGHTEKESVSSGSNASIGYDDFFFGKFCRHIPRILRHQLISKLVNQYVYKMKETDDMPDSAPNHVVSTVGNAGVDFKANTSIYRFHGALLFVDISGFTVLSQKLKVDDLKNHINAYFQKIVDIIDKYDGEIIKFAGDALFIVWQTKVSDTADENFLQASKDVTDKAVTCGKEINLKCGNYLIRLGPDTSSEGSAKVQNLLQSIGNPTRGGRRTPRKSPKASLRPGTAAKKKARESQVTYLNVHAGVSVGVMAGMDVGAHDRFEYLLLGQPMNDVAIAEGDAGKGEIVISPTAHALLHGFASLQSSAPTTAREVANGVTVTAGDGAGPHAEGGGASSGCHSGLNVDVGREHPLTCGCTVTPSGYFNINTGMEDVLSTVDFAATAAARSNNAAMMQLDTRDFEGDKDLQYEFETYAHVIEELMSGYKAVSSLLQKEFAGLFQKMSEEPTQVVETESTEARMDLSSSASGSSDNLGRKANLEYTEKEALLEHFFSWAQHCLLDDIAKHVHQVLMENFRRELGRTSGGGIVRHSVGSTSSSYRTGVLAASVSTNSSIATKHNGGRHGESFVTKMRQLTGLGTLKDRKHNKHQKVLSKDGALVSELRNVIVLFISVKMDNSSVYRDSDCANHEAEQTIQTCKVDSFHFLNRTKGEIEADKKLINQFQSCMEVLTERDRMHAFDSLGAVKAKGYANPVPIFQPHFGVIDDDTAQLRLQHPGDELHGVRHQLSKVFGRKDAIVDMFRFFICDAVKGGLDELVRTFWNKTVTEDDAAREALACVAEPFDFNAKKSGPHKEQPSNLVQSPKKVRFDHHMTIKKFVVKGPNGIGKTAVLNLLQHKLHALVALDEEYYNIAILRHQVGYINSTTLFSAWFCLVRQILHNIATALAATGDAHMVACLTAFQDDDCTPLIDFLKDYLTPLLRPFTSLLTLVGIKFKPRADGAAVAEDDSPVVDNDAEMDTMDAMGNLQSGSGDTDPDSGEINPMNTLDPSDKLKRCAELIVAIIQLHVSITRKVTLYIMDDLQMHDVASQDLGRLISDQVTGVLLLSTYRTAPQSADEGLRADSHGQPLTLADATTMFAPGLGFFEAAMRSMPESPTLRKAELPPLCDSAIKKLLLRISASYGLVNVDDVVLDKLYALSAGSPLYATELAKAVCSQYVAREYTIVSPSNEARSDGMLTIISSMRTDRIEEMVHFRFDKLTEPCQLVLKMAAVASLNGSHFTLSMLTSILDSSDSSESTKLDAMIATTHSLLGYLSDPDNDGENGNFNRGNPINSSMDLVQAINDLLESEDFIEFRGDMENMESLHEDGANSSYNVMQLTTAAAPVMQKPDLTRLQSESDWHNRNNNDGHDRCALRQLQFYWKVDMELRAIYDLMLNEQKESLHDRVASFLEQEADKNDTNTATDWYEQAFHWERATAWSSAMTCYFNAGMQLKEQGDSQGAKGHLTSAYRMMDKMRHDAGVNFLDGTRLTTQCAATSFDTLTRVQPYRLSVQNISEIEQHSREFLLLVRRNAGMKLEDLHHIFEGSSAVLHSGLSVLVRLAQSLTGFFHANEFSYRMCEDALDVLVLAHRSNVVTMLQDVDGGPFLLRDDEIGFPVFSGLFVMLLNDLAFEADKYQRMVAAVSLHMAYTSAKPEYELHLILAYQNKIRLLESFMHIDPAAIAPIISYTDTMWTYYNCEKHSKDLIHYYSSDRTGNATSVAVKVLYMQGHFAQSTKYLNLIKETAFKIKHFFSTGVTVFAAYPILLLCNPDAEAQIIIQKLAAREAKQMNKELSEPKQIYREALNLTIQHQQYARSEDEAVFHKESVFVENILQSRSLVQKDAPVYHLNTARRYFMAVEYVAARICYLKALRWELHAAAIHKSNTDTIAAYQEKAQSYLLLGLEHLTFTPEQDERNEQLLFAKANERLLRVQLLFKLIASCVDAEKAHIMWTTAHDNVEKTVQLAERCNFQLLLLQAGMHLQTLAIVIFPPLSSTTPNEAALSTEQNGQTDDASQEHAALCASLQQRGIILESVARAYIEKVNKDSGLDLEEIYRSILMQYPSA